MEDRPIVVGITGASGAPYARRLVRFLAEREIPFHVVISAAGRMVYRMETGNDLEADVPPDMPIYEEREWAAPVASGSFLTRGMVVVPCTMASLAAIARGMAHTLVHRAADVCLKERRRLVVVPRETPLHAVHLENMLALCRAGAVVLPPMPGFYHAPRTVEDMVDFVVARILDHLGVPHQLVPRWSGAESLGG